MTAARKPLLLFGAPVGLYTGKIRCYLRKQGIAYSERLPSDPVFNKELLPLLKRFINPVIKTADGVAVQDTADIIDFLEAQGYARTPSTPTSPKQRIVALILDLFGGEGLIRPAMHYRWSYRAQNEAFLRHEFGLSYRTGRQPPEVIEKRLDDFMRYLSAYIPKFGITAQTAGVVEASYEDLMARLDAHFRAHPYAMGGVPTIADYGLIAPLYAHLARDPYPANLMKLKAPSLYRWTERMNACDADVPEFPRYALALPEDDAIADTLLPVLEFIASDFLPEAQATAQALDAWIAKQGERDLTNVVADRGLTQGRFELRGVTIDTVVQPYLLYKLQRVTDGIAALPAADAQMVRGFLRPLGLEPLLDLKARRRIERKDFLEVWGALVS